MHRQVLNDVHLWDGAEDRGTVDLTWSADDGRVAAVTAAAGSSGAATEPLSVLPGLIDTHVHLIGNASSRPADFLSWPVTTRPEEQVLHGLANAQTALRSGVTTVRDLSADDIQFSLARALSQHIVTGPRLLAFGIVNMTGGHGDMFTPAAVANRRPVADGADQCRALVRHWARAGADGIKVPTSGGVLSAGDKPSWRNYTDAELDALVDEAHALGMKVAAHAHTEAGIAAALRHGVDSIEHGTLLTADQAQLAADRGVTVAPTLLINDRIAAGTVSVTAEQQDAARALVIRRDAALREAAERGVEFVLGTDANGFHVGFGDQFDEVRAMARVFEWTPARALEAATSRAARAIGLENVVGRLVPGHAADFVVFRGQPARTLDDLRVENIVAVVSRGVLVHGALPVAG